MDSGAKRRRLRGMCNGRDDERNLDEVFLALEDTHHDDLHFSWLEYDKESLLLVDCYWLTIFSSRCTHSKLVLPLLYHIRLETKSCRILPLTYGTKYDMT